MANVRTTAVTLCPARASRFLAFECSPRQTCKSQRHLAGLWWNVDLSSYANWAPDQVVYSFFFLCNKMPFSWWEFLSADNIVLVNVERNKKVRTRQFRHHRSKCNAEFEYPPPPLSTLSGVNCASWLRWASFVQPLPSIRGYSDAQLSFFFWNFTRHMFCNGTALHQRV